MTKTNKSKKSTKIIIKKRNKNKSVKNKNQKWIRAIKMFSELNDFRQKTAVLDELLYSEQKIFIKEEMENLPSTANSIMDQFFSKKFENIKYLSILGKFIKEKKIKVAYEKKVPENIIFPPIKPLLLKKKAIKIVKERELQQVIKDVKDITVLNITLKPNNMFFIFTDNNGDTLMRSSSSGGLKIIVSKKTMRKSIGLVLRKYQKRFKKRLKKRKIKLGEVVAINVKGSRRSRRTVIFALQKIFFKEFRKGKENRKIIIDYPYIKSFNGCRGLSLKRKKRWRPKRYSSIT